MLTSNSAHSSLCFSATLNKYLPVWIYSNYLFLQNISNEISWASYISVYFFDKGYAGKILARLLQKMIFLHNLQSQLRVARQKCDKFHTRARLLIFAETYPKDLRVSNCKCLKRVPFCKDYRQKSMKRKSLTDSMLVTQ